MNEPAPLLSVEDLSVEFRTRSGTVHALDRVSFDIRAGETLGLVGESGSGKSVTSLAIMGILERTAQVTSGRILFRGHDLLAEKESRLRDTRGRDLAMIFQNPRSALNPIRPVGKQIADVLEQHAGLGRAQAQRRAIDVLRSVRIADPERRARAYPFELSGGMCQRIMIATALSCKPALLIADEPTTGLDVTIQAVIMKLIAELAAAEGMATLLITHDLALAAEQAERIAVMHAGHVVEIAPTAELISAPRHPYTQRLIAATPEPHAKLRALASIPGSLPDLRRDDLPPCRFSKRCERYQPECDAPLPLRQMAPQHSVACWRPL
jgi:peptide/nickel transport system ATP-binding protein